MSFICAVLMKAKTVYWTIQFRVHACRSIYYVQIVGTYTASYIELQLHENIQLVSWHRNLHLNYKCTHQSNCMKIYS